MIKWILLVIVPIFLVFGSYKFEQTVDILSRSVKIPKISWLLNDLPYCFNLKLSYENCRKNIFWKSGSEQQQPAQQYKFLDAHGSEEQFQQNLLVCPFMCL